MIVKIPIYLETDAKLDPDQLDLMMEYLQSSFSSHINRILTEPRIKVLMDKVAKTLPCCTKISVISKTEVMDIMNRGSKKSKTKP